MPIRRQRILVIEKEPVLLDLLTFHLELLGYEVVCKGAGDAAVDWLGENVVDLVAVGSLPDMDPIELLNHLSDDTSTSETPLLLLSADCDSDAAQRPDNAGIDQCLLTPFDPLVLEKTVHDLLSTSATH